MGFFLIFVILKFANFTSQIVIFSKAKVINTKFFCQNCNFNQNIIKIDFLSKIEGFGQKNVVLIIIYLLDRKMGNF